MDAEQLCAHYVQSSAYSDTATVTSCSRQSQYMKSWRRKFS